ncbi:GNAT family N-acetyltransferase [Neobacillus sp. NPDC093182]|uniref:GNAT family N-acetyltransferase n=1 Tax=Neobacillus sp. NPDC093182 TaxID=3364297 RepID=UPI0038001417
MIAEFRLLKTEIEYKQAITLADKTFRDNEQISMGKAYPFVFSPELNQSYGAFVNGELVSFIGLVPSIVHIEEAEIQAYSIGAVCTHPNHRKNGYASTLLSKVFEHAELADASLLFVSGNLPMYMKAGCAYYGEMNKYKIQKGELSTVEGCFVRESLPHDRFRLRKLAHSRRVHFEQSILDFTILNHAEGFASNHKMRHKLLLAEAGNELKGFLILGVSFPSSSDSPARVIEWGGDPKAIQALLAESFQYGITSIKCSFPSYEVALNRLLNNREKTVTPYPGTIKIINLELLLKQLEPFLRGKVEIEDIDENNKKLVFNQRSMTLDNASLERLILQGAPDLDCYLKDIFPIPLPFPEGLNYV